MTNAPSDTLTRYLAGLEGDVDRPQLRVRDGVDASKLVLASDPPRRAPRRRR